MSSVCTLTTTRPYVTSSIEWNIKDLFLHFNFCEPCSIGQHNLHACTMMLDSEVMTIEEGNGNSVKLQLHCGKDNVCGATHLKLYISFHGMVNDSQPGDSEQIHYKYEMTVDGGRMSQIRSTNNATFTPQLKRSYANICTMVHFFHANNGLWPHGDLKINLTLFRLLNTNHKVIAGYDNEAVAEISLASSFRPLVNNPDISDVKILCGETTLFAHKFLLSVRSPVFCAMLKADMVESRANEIEITEMKAEVVRMMLDYIYTGNVAIPTNSKYLLELLDCAEKYELKGLKSLCLQQMMRSLNNQTAGEFAVAADFYNASLSTKKTIKDYCMRNHQTLMKNDEYKKQFSANLQAFLP